MASSVPLRFVRGDHACDTVKLVSLTRHATTAVLLFIHDTQKRVIWRFKSHRCRQFYSSGVSSLSSIWRHPSGVMRREWRKTVISDENGCRHRVVILAWNLRQRVVTIDDKSWKLTTPVVKFDDTKMAKNGRKPSLFERCRQCRQCRHDKTAK